MKNFYLGQIERKKQDHPELYEEMMQNRENKNVEEFSSDELITFMVAFEKRIKITESSYDIRKLARAIQHSRSGVGGCAMTPFTCLFCAAEETWGNTATPGICKTCATDMATNIVLQRSEFLKD